MQRPSLSTAATLAIALLVCGCGDTNYSGSPSVPSSPPQASAQETSNPEVDSSPPQASAQETSNPEVDRVFSERTKKYEQELSAWNAANKMRAEAEAEKVDLQKQIDELDRDKPMRPQFQEREWGTNDKKYNINAVLVDTDNNIAKLKKSDGKTVTVPRDKLNFEGRVYLETAHRELTKFPDRLKEWDARRQKLTDKLTSVDARIASADRPKPTKPSRQHVTNEIAAEDAKKKEQERIAQQEAARERQKTNLDQFMARLSVAGIDNSVDSVSVKGDSATITVTNPWHFSPYQIRLQVAQNLWKTWASIASPADVDKARIKLVDFNGNAVGGSRVLGGSLIWVKEN